MKRFGLIGYPLGHSWSAAYLNTRFKEEGMDAVYETLEIADLNDLLAMLHDKPDLIGFNVTIPHKCSILPYLDELTHEAASIGAVNTVWVKRTRHGIQLIGHNTDAGGLTKALDVDGVVLKGRALILGKGGAARAAAYVFQSAGLPFTYICRNPSSDTDISFSQAGIALISDHNIIVNATPLGMHPDISSLPPIPYEGIGKSHVLYDMVYNPEMTAFMQNGAQRGARVYNGLHMLHAQAELALKWWTERIITE